MSMLGRSGMILAVLVTASAVAGCANDRQNTQLGGAAFGAAVGCGLGYLIGGGGTDCALGAAAGGATGLVAGSYVADEKGEYVAQEDYLNTEIASAQQMNSALAQRNAQLKADLAARQKRLVSLEQMASSSSTAKSKLLGERDSLRKQVGQLQPALKSATAELESQRSLLAQAKQQSASPATVAELQTQVTTMERNVAEMRQLVQQYADVDDRISRSL